MEKIPIKISHFNKRGWGVGEHFEVIGAIPGDEVLVEPLSRRRGRGKGIAREVIKASSLRVVPRCIHAPGCGGCTWQQMDYQAQLSQKEKIIEDCFPSEKSLPILACEHPWQYRNKMEFSFSQNRAGERFLGLILAGSRGHVLNLSECHLVSKWMIDGLSLMRQWWEESGLAAYRMNDTGALRTLTLREGKRTGDRLVMLTVSGNPDYALKAEQLKSFVDLMKEQCDSLFLRVHQIKKGSPTQFFEMHLHGKDHVKEKLILAEGELTFKISPTSFFQPNTLQAERLYSEAVTMITGRKRHVLDLYAGTATLGMAFAKIADHVTCIELNPHATFDAEVNKELNGIDNLEIICGDVGKKLEELRGREGFVAPDLIIVDPPRTGLDATAISHLLCLNCPEILYISCNPTTQAENIRALTGYSIVTIQPVDQFPHTPHIENIVLLRR